MKRTLLALASLVASYCASASPAATQSWVKDYVATNSTGGGGSSISTLLAPTTVTVYDDNGSPATVTFNWCQNTNLALRVYDSNVSGMTNGLTFAKTADMRYYNATNYACQYITGQVEKVRMIFTSAVDRVVGNVTNTVYTGTNYIYGVVYYAHVNGTRFRSFQTASNIYAFQPDTTNADSRIFYAIETYVSDITRNKIVTDPSFADVKKRKFSFWELFFPSAYAGWGEWEGPIGDLRLDPPNPQPGQAYVIYGKYQRHYFTDEEKTYSLGTITWTLVNGETASYSIDLAMPFSIPAGADRCTISNDDTSDITDEWLWEKLEDALPKGRYQQLKRSESASSAISTKLASIKSQYASDLSTVLKITCPETEDRVVGRDVADCGNNHYWIGTCGNWTCKRCGEKDTEPSSHTYNSSSDKCDKCKNKHTGKGLTATCKFRPSEIEYHRGWHEYDGIAGHRCACSCGKYKLDHQDPQTAKKYVSIGGAICYRIWTCERCGEVVGEDCIPPEEQGVTITATSHSYSGGGSFTQYVTNGVNMCKGDYNCNHAYDSAMPANGCGAHVNEIMDHLPTNVATSVTEIPGDHVSHSNGFPCIRGCGYVLGKKVRHNYAISRDPEKVDDVGLKPPDSERHYSYKACSQYEDSITEENQYNYCGHIHIVSSNRHDWAVTTYGNPTLTTHDVTNKCSVCQYKKFVAREAHTNFYSRHLYHYIDDSTHSISDVCVRCSTKYLIGVTNHVPFVGAVSDMPCSYIDDHIHAVSNLCADCVSFYYIGTYPHWSITTNANNADLCVSIGDTHHVCSNKCEAIGCSGYFSIGAYPHWSITTNANNADKYEYISNGYHRCMNKCGAFGCDGFFSIGTAACNRFGAWSYGGLVGVDYVTCTACSHSNSLNHTWTYVNAYQCKCSNGSGHLLGDHTFVNNICSKCRYNQSTGKVEDDTITYSTVYCPSCYVQGQSLGCYAEKKFVNGSFDSYTTKHCGNTINASCEWEWDMVNDKCGCPMCQLGVPNMCQCLSLYITYGPAIGPMFGSNQTNQ